jgi:hypothetical protein
MINCNSLFRLFSCNTIRKVAYTCCTATNADQVIAHEPIRPFGEQRMCSQSGTSGAEKGQPKEGRTAIGIMREMDDLES